MYGRCLRCITPRSSAPGAPRRVALSVCRLLVAATSPVWVIQMGHLRRKWCEGNDVTDRLHHRRSQFLLPRPVAVRVRHHHVHIACTELRRRPVATLLEEQLVPLPRKGYEGPMIGAHLELEPFVAPFACAASWSTFSTSRWRLSGRLWRKGALGWRYRLRAPASPTVTGLSCYRSSHRRRQRRRSS